MSQPRTDISAPPYSGEQIAFLTRHGKEKIVAPMLEYAFGWHIRHVDGFDTDRLGTFTREIPRRGSQLQTAVQKARIGMDLADCRLGLASEGAFGPDPVAGLMPCNVEMLVLVDDERGLRVAGEARGPANMGNALTDSWTGLLEFARLHDFPNHALVLRPEGVPAAAIRKGLNSRSMLRAAFDEAIQISPSHRILCEVDLRAHCNPTRRVIIRKAAENLIERLLSACPLCGSPGYWPGDVRTGLPCAWCRAPTHEVVADVWTCPGCGHSEVRDRQRAEFADPRHCDNCNP